jgi:hypothetical protein
MKKKAKIDPQKQALLKSGPNQTCQIGSGTGFLCNINIEEIALKVRVLITSNHILNEQDIQPGKKIQFSTDSGDKKYEIEINKERRKYISEKYDIVIIEIKEEDKLPSDSFEIDENIFAPDYNFTNKTIYSLDYRNCFFSFSEGNIKKVGVGENTYEIEHTCKAVPSSLGAPLVNKENTKVIGMHINSPQGNDSNYGILLKEPIIEFTKQIINEEELDAITIKYKIVDIEDTKKIRLFGDIFVERNKNI